MSKLDTLFYKARKTAKSVPNIIFMNEGICCKCHNTLEQCSCRKEYANEIIIDFVRASKMGKVKQDGKEENQTQTG